MKFIIYKKQMINMKKILSPTKYLILLTLILSGCSNNISPISEISDPFENLNRKIFSFNNHLDANIVNPLSKKYVKIVPTKTRESISNHINWIDLPNTIINSSLQFNLENTILASAKFLLNGLTLGFYDLDNNETKVIKRDLGSTLAKYKISEGPFLIVPLLGPRTTRDFTGFIGDAKNISNISSTDLNTIKVIGTPVGIIDKRNKLSDTLESINKSSDPYIKMRSYYVQNRRAIVYDKKYNEVKNKKKDEEFEQLLQ